MASKAQSESPKLDIPRHTKFWLRCASLLPSQYTSNDASRVSLGFFIVSALDLLNALPQIPEAEIKSWKAWLYSLQVPEGGFRGFSGTNLGAYRNMWNRCWDVASLANTHLALLSLVVLGDDLTKVDAEHCMKWVASLQRPNGSFGEFLGEGGEVIGGDDLRTVYCAVGIVYMLCAEGEGNGVPIDVYATMRFIESCQDYDGGCGQSPLREGHSGVNFCAVAAMDILRKLQRPQAKRRLVSSFNVGANIDWMLQRQTSWVNEDDEEEEEDEVNDAEDVGQDMNGAIDEAEAALSAGFNGRPAKMADTCYCFWNTGALAIFDASEMVDVQSLRAYLLQDVQHMIGGFSKSPGAHPDVMHSYLGLACLALYREDGLKAVDPVFAVSKDTAQRLELIREKMAEDNR
jgi:geranylgeranyl transferase type-1 subunit beta